MPYITVSKKTHEEMREWNERNHGRGMDITNTYFNPDGSATFFVDDQVMARLNKLSSDPEMAILKAIQTKLS